MMMMIIIIYFSFYVVPVNDERDCHQYRESGDINTCLNLNLVISLMRFVPPKMKIDPTIVLLM
jgi:hypothetical protein